MITLKFYAVTGNAFATESFEDMEGGFIYTYGLAEFLSEGLNDYFIAKLGHFAFGSGLQFQDFSHKGKIDSYEVTNDGVYIYLD